MNRCVYFVCAAFSLSGPAYGTDPERQGLFRIERSKNANIVQYDAQLDRAGGLDTREPVTAYWVRLAEQGQLKKLSWSQKAFAYGFKARFEPGSDAVTLIMKAKIGRTITVRRKGQVYRAICRIAGTPSYLERIFVKSSGKGLSTRVHYMELHGKDIATGEVRYERFVP